MTKGKYYILSLTSPCGLVVVGIICNLARVCNDLSSIVSPRSLVIVEYHVGNNKAFGNLKGQRTAIDAQLRTGISAPEAGFCTAILILRRNGQSNIPLCDGQFFSDITVIHTTCRCRNVHLVEVERILIDGIGLEGVPLNLSSVLLTGTTIDALDTNLVPVS